MFERRRNHLIYSQTDNPSFYQRNRNPYVDHPELVWSVFAGGLNDSKLYLGDTEPADGASSQDYYFGQLVEGAAVVGLVPVTLNKVGSDPTTFAVRAEGAAQAINAGPREAFTYGPGSQLIQIGPGGLTVNPGPQSGTVTIDNTDLTSSGTGLGSADADDVINISYDVIAHAEASFAPDADLDQLVLDLGTWPAQSGVQSITVTIHNLETAPGYTAPLDILDITGTGDTTALFTDLQPTPGISPGSSVTFAAQLNTAVAPGLHTAAYTIEVSDSEDLYGARPGTDLTLTLAATVAPGTCPGDTNCDLVIDFDDITLFVRAIGDDGTAWAALYESLYGTAPTCDFLNADCNEDGGVDFDDISPFVDLIPGICRD
jgi:hypothetical protein